MLIVDGVKYRSWTPEREIEEFEPFVEKYSKEIFGEETLYFSVKTKLKTLGGIGSIPDGYVIKFSKPQEWFIIEVELSKHPLFDHIVPQLNKFVQGIRNPNSRAEIVEALYNEIKGDIETESYVKKKLGSGEIYRFIKNLIDQSPILVIIIDKRTKELEDACNSIPLENKYIVEFKIYERIDAGIKNAVFFEPIYELKKPPSPRPLSKGEITPQSEYTLPIIKSLIEMGGSGRAREVLDKVFNKMKDRLTPADLEKTPSGISIRWKNHAMWERLRLKREGYLKADSPRGIWEISEKGRALYKTKVE